LPRHVSLDRGRQLLGRGLPWIRKHLQRVQAAQADPSFDRIEARKVLVERLRHLAQTYGYTFNKVFVKDQKTLWGSCSAANNINLNVNLVRLPRELADYVLVHELVHTRHKNHGRAFWSELNGIVGDGRSLQKRLRQYRPRRQNTPST
jgi:predicted metal-dependent hydrolase